MHFEMDEEVIVWKTRQFWLKGRPFLIGGGTPLGFHIGPAFYYLSSFPLVLSNGDPLAWGVMAAAVGGLTIALLWIVGKKLGGDKTGYLAALLWATSFVPIMTDRHWWPLVLNPLLMLLCVWSIAQILKGRKNWWIIQGVILSFAWQADLSVLGLFLATAMIVGVRMKQDFKKILTAVVIIVFSLLPLVIFELRHPGSNLGKVTEFKGFERLSLSPTIFIEVLDVSSRSVSRLLFPVANADGNLENFYTWCKDIAKRRITEQTSLGMATGLVLLLTPSALFVSRRLAGSDLLDPALSKSLSLTTASTVLGAVFYRSLGGELFDFYFSTLYPIAVLSAAFIIFRLRAVIGVWAGIAIAGAIVITNVVVFSKSYHPQGLSVKRSLVHWVTERVGGRPFALESLSGCSRYNGVRYLFLREGNEPSLSFMDPNLFWLYDSLPWVQYPDTFVVTATPRDLTQEDRTRYNLFEAKATERATFGDFEALVVDNHDRGFTIRF